MPTVVEQHRGANRRRVAEQARSGSTRRACVDRRVASPVGSAEAGASGHAEPGAPIPEQAPNEVPISGLDRGRFIAGLYAEHGDFLLSFIMRLTGGDRHWAEDVVQETMTRAWRHAEQLATSGASSLRPWLTKVARRVVINNRRSQRVRPQEVDAPLEIVSVSDDTDRALLRA